MERPTSFATDVHNAQCSDQFDETRAPGRKIVGIISESSCPPDPIWSINCVMMARCAINRPAIFIASELFAKPDALAFVGRPGRRVHMLAEASLTNFGTRGYFYKNHLELHHLTDAGFSAVHHAESGWGVQPTTLQQFEPVGLGSTCCWRGRESTRFASLPAIAPTRCDQSGYHRSSDGTDATWLGQDCVCVHQHRFLGCRCADARFSRYLVRLGRGY